MVYDEKSDFTLPLGEFDLDDEGDEVRNLKQHTFVP